MPEGCPLAGTITWYCWMDRKSYTVDKKLYFSSTTTHSDKLEPKIKQVTSTVLKKTSMAFPASVSQRFKLKRFIAMWGINTRRIAQPTFAGVLLGYNRHLGGYFHIFPDQDLRTSCVSLQSQVCGYYPFYAAPAGRSPVADHFFAKQCLALLNAFVVTSLVYMLGA